MTVEDRLHVQMAYIKLMEALSEMEKIRYRDSMLENVRLVLSMSEDVMKNYVGPSGRTE